MKIIIQSSHFSGLDDEQQAEARSDYEALGAEIHEDGDYMAALQAAQDTIRMGIFGGFMQRMRGTD